MNYFVEHLFPFILFGIALTILLVIFIKYRKKKPEEEVKYRPLPNPYVIQMKNVTNKEAEGVLFGFSKYWNSKNFGSDDGVWIDSQMGNSYSHLLSDSAFNPFSFYKIRIRSGAKDPFKDDALFHFETGTGTHYQAAISIIRENAVTHDRIQKNLLDIPFAGRIDSGSHLKFKLQPKETLVVTIFPVGQFPDGTKYPPPLVSNEAQDREDELQERRDLWDEERRLEFEEYRKKVAEERTKAKGEIE